MASIKVGFQLWGQNSSWAELMEAARTIEGLGFDSLWSNDHFYPIIGDSDVLRDNQAGPMFEGWMLLAGFVCATERIRAGIMVSGSGYRNPALLVKMATTLDHASGGRVVLGLGAGWMEREHRSFGFTFPSVKGRLDRLEESASIARSMLAGETVTMDGDWYQVVDAHNDPGPVGGSLPLLIGGSGEIRTLKIVAGYADWWNGEGSPADMGRKNRILDEYCAQRGRVPSDIYRTVGVDPVFIRSTMDAAVEGMSEVLTRHGLDADAARGVAARSPAVGTINDVTNLLHDYQAAGVAEAIFDLPSPYDLETLEALSGPVRDKLTP